MPDASNDEFLFTCPSCSFEQPVPLEKRGSAIVCKGCNSTVFVPSEEAVDDTEDEYALSSEWEEPKRSVPVYASEEESLPLAGGTEEDTIREPEPAEEEEAEEEEEEEGYHRPELPERPMFTGVLGFLATKEAIVLTIGLTIAGAIVLSLQLAGLVFDSVGSSGDGEVGGIGKFFAFLTWGTLGLMWAVWAFEAGLTVLQEAAAGSDRIDGLPELSWMDWVADALFVFAPLASAGVLGYIIASVLPFGTLFWVSLGIFFLFPIFFLSALDEQFWIGFHSLRVYKSLGFARGAWGALYLYQLVLIGILGVATAVAWGLHRALVGSPSWIIGFNIMGVFLALAGVLSLLVYARALGRLVWVISETEKGLENEEEVLEDEEEDEAEESEGEE